MINFIGQCVKIFLRNSMVLEGIVEDWTEQSVILKSLDQQSHLIIHHPTQDIVLTKVVYAPPEEEQPEPGPEITSNLSEEIEEIPVEEEIDLRAKSLVELKQLKAQQERKILVEKMKDHHLGQVSQKVAYEQPGFRTKPRIK